MAAQPRALRYPWTGGFVSLARAAGVERIAETFRAPRSCSARDADLDFDLFPSPVLPVTAPRASTIDRRKAGPNGTGRNDVAIAENDNTRVRRGRRSAA